MNGRVSRLLAPSAAIVLSMPGVASAQDEIRSERVRFEQGATSAVVEASIQGYEIVDYVLGASEGQYMNVSMATDNTASYFNILEPGETDVAIVDDGEAGVEEDVEASDDLDEAVED